MNREEFEQRMADALGGELSEQDRADFEAALAEDEAWRREYDEALRTLDVLGTLSGPAQLRASRDGDRLVIEPAPTQPPRVSTGTGSGRWRIAAAILMAFTAGYAAHAVLVLSEGVNPQRQVVQSAEDIGVPEEADRNGGPDARRPDIRGSDMRGRDRRALDGAESLQSALVRAHAQRPSSSTLAKCMIAVATRR